MLVVGGAGCVPIQDGGAWRVEKFAVSRLEPAVPGIRGKNSGRELLKVQGKKSAGVSRRFRTEPMNTGVDPNERRSEKVLTKPTPVRKVNSLASGLFSRLTMRTDRRRSGRLCTATGMSPVRQTRDLRATRPPADAPPATWFLQKPVGVSSQGESKLTELGVDQLAEMVDQEEMSLLRRRATLAGDNQVAGGEALGFAAAAAEEGYGGEVEVFCLVEGGENVGGIAAGGEHDEQIFRAREAGDLAREGVFVAVVVDDAGEEGAVGGEGDSWQGAAVFGVTADEFGGKMGGLSGAAAIAADQ